MDPKCWSCSPRGWTSSWTCPKCAARGATKVQDPALAARLAQAVRDWAAKGDK
jgi:hypothetical protein